eukprot:scaffold1183_cov418-Prasinococcus_capsulatus_cf.AAC.26
MVPTATGLYIFLLTLLYFAPSVPHSTTITVVILICYSGLMSIVSKAVECGWDCVSWKGNRLRLVLFARFV